MRATINCKETVNILKLIKEIIFNDAVIVNEIMRATINCKETVNILKLIKEYAFLDESVCGTFNQFLDKRDSLIKEIVKLNYDHALLCDYSSYLDNNEDFTRCFIEMISDAPKMQTTVIITKEGNLLTSDEDGKIYSVRHPINTTEGIEQEITSTRFWRFLVHYNSDNIWEIKSTMGRDCQKHSLDIPQPLTHNSRVVFRRHRGANDIYTLQLDVESSTPNPKRLAQEIAPVASPQDTTPSQQKTSWFRFNISLMLSFVFNKPFMLSFVLFIFIFLVLI